MASQDIWSLDETSKRSQRRRAQTTISLLKPLPTDLILDIGCSEGFITSNLLSANFIVGFDSCRDSLLIAAKHLRQSNVSFVLGDAAFLPFKDAFFDKITLLEVLEHMPAARQRIVGGEADRVLKPKGTIVISVPYKETIIQTRCVHCGELTPLWGHLEPMDEQKVIFALPQNYVEKNQYHIINLQLISLSLVFEMLPFRLWLSLNNLLGRFRKGYWIIFSFIKS